MVSRTSSLGEETTSEITVVTSLGGSGVVIASATSTSVVAAVVDEVVITGLLVKNLLRKLGLLVTSLSPLTLELVRGL